MQVLKVAVIIQKGGQFLLVQEAAPRARGLWNWVQGGVEKGEELEHAAIREAKEETGFDIEIRRKVAVIDNPFPDTSETHVFMGEIVGGELKVPEGEILQVQWFTADEIKDIKGQMPGPWVSDSIHSLAL